MMCNICGIEYDTSSMGGPGICPRCDCGNLETGGIKRQQERIAALEAENARSAGTALRNTPKGRYKLTTAGIARAMASRRKREQSVNDECT